MISSNKYNNKQLYIIQKYSKFIELLDTIDNIEISKTLHKINNTNLTIYKSILFFYKNNKKIATIILFTLFIASYFAIKSLTN